MLKYCSVVRWQMSAADRLVGADKGSEAAFWALWNLSTIARCATTMPVRETYLGNTNSLLTLSTYSI